MVRKKPPPFDAIIDARATKPVIYRADFAHAERRDDAHLVDHGCMVYPTLQEALDAGRQSIYVRGMGKAERAKARSVARRKNPPRIDGEEA